MKTLPSLSCERAFTLLELLVVMALIATLSFFLLSNHGEGGRSASLRAAQAQFSNLLALARTQAMASGQSCRMLVNVDPSSASEPRRYLRYVVVQLQTTSSWQTLTDAFLPDSVYIVPGNFSSLPAGLFAVSENVPWTKVDGSALRSTALRSNRITTETINGSTAEQWVNLTLSSASNTTQSGDIILINGRPRPPGSFAEGEAPVVLENPGNVRGLTLSVYGVPALINSRTSF
jgi:prepilin-type N-terminal cleavage/methylation domain-containing protein